MRAPTLTASLVATIAMSAAAAAQTAGASAPAGAGPVTGWSATAGREAFEFRDISRNMNPPDASPVKWRGQGPVLTVQYERARPRSSHMAPISGSLILATSNTSRPTISSTIGPWDSNSNVAYNTGAAFLAFLIDRYGTAKLRQVYYTPSSDFARRAAEIYGRPLEALAEEWLAAI